MPRSPARCARSRNSTRSSTIGAARIESRHRKSTLIVVAARWVVVDAWAAITSGVPFANGAPNLTVDIPALQELAREHNVPICGKDFKTGQTLLKTILAPGFKARMLGLNGWFSTNILGNRDGEVLDDPESFKTKEESKLG